VNQGLTTRINWRFLTIELRWLLWPWYILAWIQANLSNGWEASTQDLVVI